MKTDTEADTAGTLSYLELPADLERNWNVPALPGTLRAEVEDVC